MEYVLNDSGSISTSDGFTRSFPFTIPSSGGRADLKHTEKKRPSGKRSHNYGKSPCLMGKSTISMVIFNSYVSLPEGKWDGT